MTKMRDITEIQVELRDAYYEYVKAGGKLSKIRSYDSVRYVFLSKDNHLQLKFMLLRGIMCEYYNNSREFMFMRTLPLDIMGPILAVSKNTLAKFAVGDYWSKKDPDVLSGVFKIMKSLHIITGGFINIMDLYETTLRPNDYLSTRIGHYLKVGIIFKGRDKTKNPEEIWEDENGK